MAAAKQRRALQRSSSLPSSASSSGTNAVGIAHKYDHLIGEQKVLVLNAQEGLKQALSILKKATSKDEQESAGMQVSSLLSRCEELIMKLKVVLYIRHELEQVHEEIINKRKLQENPTKLYSRQQWLEGRIEKLLLARRRGRPGARGQRTTSQDNSLSSTQQGLPSLSQRGRGPLRPGRVSLIQTRPHDFKEHLPPLHQKASTIGTPSDFMSTVTGDKDEDSSDNATFISTVYSQRTGATRSAATERDSDEWCSESEANWTTINDFTMKKDPEHCDTKEQGREKIPSNECKDISPVSIGVQETCYSFERPRSKTVFGSCSWNLLSMANYTNLFNEDQFELAQVPNEVLNNPLLNDELVILWADIKRLQELVISAAKNVISVGGKVVVVKERTASQRSGKVKRVTLSSVIQQESGKSDVTCQNDSNEQIWNASAKIPDPPIAKPKWSRRIYGKEVTKGNTYPRPTSAWYQTSISQNVSVKVLREIGDIPSQKPFNKQMSYSRQLSKGKQSRARSSSAIKRVDLSGDLADYKEKQVEDLVKALKSSDIVERRRDAAHALSVLTSVENYTTILETLSSTMLSDSDPVVRYEAVKALMKHGAWTDQLDCIVAKLLSNGTYEIQNDLLGLLVNEMDKLVVWLTETQTTSDDDNIFDKSVLLRTLRKLLENKDVKDSVSFQAAIILSNCMHFEQLYEERLRQALTNGSPHQQSLALHTLIMNVQNIDLDILNSALEQAEHMIDWKYRLKAVNCLIQTGVQLLSQYDDNDILQFVLKRLANEPIQAIKVSLGDLATNLGLRPRCESDLYKRLESVDEMQRAEAVMSLGGFVTANSRVQNVLMDTVELDPSTYVRLAAASVLSKSKRLNSVVMSRLMSRCEGSGPVARQCRNTFKTLSTPQLLLYQHNSSSKQ